MVIRHAVGTDLDDIDKGYREHFSHEKKYGAYTVFQEGVYPTRIVAETALQDGALYVCEESGAVLGSIILDQKQPEEYKTIEWPSRALPGEASVIHLLMVRPCAAGRGVGSALVNYALDTAKRHSCISVRLDTGKQNLPAVSLYKKLGFQLIAASTMKVGNAISHDGHLFFEKII